jgi:hypothetical protein
LKACAGGTRTTTDFRTLLSGALLDGDFGMALISSELISFLLLLHLRATFDASRFVADGVLGDTTKVFERLVPELVEVLTNGRQTGAIDEVQSARSFGAIGHQAHVLEHLEVLGHGRPAHR